ncbi:hypothetical protein ACVGXB_07410, partial [Enterobacter intestinihominis]
QGQQITDNYTHLRQQEDTLAKMTARTWGVRYQESSDGRRFLILPPGIQTEPNPYDATTWIPRKHDNRKMTDLEKELRSPVEHLVLV